jgi:hypothetical protein
MKKTLVICALLGITICLSAFNFKGGISKTHIRTADSISADRKHYVDELRLTIKGKENLPADSVFKNIKLFKGFPAGRLISIMDIAMGMSLGVTCGHCHEPGHWELETKPAKEIARQMWAMTGTINNQLLKNIKGLQSANPGINCTTCHRGSIKPALNMPMPGANK